MTEKAKRCVEILRYCSSGNDGSHCKGCPYYFRDTKEKPCINVLWEESADLIESLSAELEQVKRERDAAVADMQKTPISLCEACARYHTGYPCSGGKYVDKINITIACTMFEWRGVKEDPHD